MAAVGQGRVEVAVAAVAVRWLVVAEAATMVERTARAEIASASGAIPGYPTRQEFRAQTSSAPIAAGQ